MATVKHVGINKSSFFTLSYPSKTVRLLIWTITIIDLSLLLDVKADDTSGKDPVYFDHLYAEGVKAYNDQLWYKCAYNLEQAVQGYRNFRKTLTDCRIGCKTGERKSQLENLPVELEEVSMFERFLKHADCFRRCKSDAYELRPGFKVTKQVENTFEKRKPYEYLQYCWFKLDRLKQGASAAYTFYLANPNDEDMHKNVAYFRDKAKVPESEFIDLELKPYKEHYIRAMLAYTEEDWTNVVEHIEKGMREYFIEEERCRVDCEGAWDNTGTLDITGAVADHFVKMLDCQLGCEGNLSVVYTEPINNFVADQYHYLQYACYKLGKINEAVQATASFLLFHPEDNVMLDNKNVIKTKYKYSDEEFLPHEDAKVYARRREKLRQLLNYLQKNYMMEMQDVIFVSSEDTESEAPSREAPKLPTTDYETWMDRYERLGLHMIAKGSDLNREYRYAADGLLKQDQCDDVLMLMEGVPVDNKSVQIFTLEYARKVLLTAEETYEAAMRLFLRATEVVRHYTQHYYNITGTLYFKHTNIVCWTHKKQLEDACIPQEFGTCEHEDKLKKNELIKDHFVTVTYLNTVDEADVYFLTENLSTETSLGVKCGRTVGFQLGDHHGVSLPSSGKRCGLVITYTTFHTSDEMEYINTIQTLHRVDEMRMASGIVNSKEILEQFENMGVRVVKNGSELQGEQRFVADGLASEAECTSLKNMVMELGKAGDGYEGQKSPHTRNEVFTGLTVEKISQSGALIGDGYDHLDLKPSLISPHTEHEMFQGLTIYRAAKLMHMGLVNTFSMKAFLSLSEKSRLLVEKYFNLTRPLFFDFTHLVCRTAIDETKIREDLSHPVHADNCVLQPNGSCLKEYPAFVQRDYSIAGLVFTCLPYHSHTGVIFSCALLYLNDDFQGGEFFFAHSNKSEQVSLRPKCGRLVGFNASEFHGVKAVQSGVRCALAMWFTHNPNFKEIAHIHARKVLRDIEKQREAEEKIKQETPSTNSEQSISDDGKASNGVSVNSDDPDGKGYDTPSHRDSSNTDQNNLLEAEKSKNDKEGSTDGASFSSKVEKEKSKEEL